MKAEPAELQSQRGATTALGKGRRASVHDNTPFKKNNPNKRVVYKCKGILEGGHFWDGNFTSRGELELTVYF